MQCGDRDTGSSAQTMHVKLVRRGFASGELLEKEKEVLVLLIT